MTFRGISIADVRGQLVEFAHPGDSDLTGLQLWRVGYVTIAAVIVTANLIGVCIVLAIVGGVVPMPSVSDVEHVRFVNGITAAAYVAFAVPAGVVLGPRWLSDVRQWLIEERPATAHEQRIVLRAPLRLFVLQLALWLAAAVIFGVLNSTYSGALGARIAIVVTLTGTITAACAYLLSERLLRPSAARALRQGMPEQLAVPGVATRAVLAWAMGTGLPVLGLVAIGIGVLAGDEGASRTQLAVAIVALGGIGIAVGLLAVALAARATADPVDSVRHALARVRRGDLDVQVPVYDGTQVGQLQLGFNQMVGGLAERERIRQAFGAYVDPDVAEHILREGTSLDGEDVEITIMFMDIRDFTGFAERTPAREVVATINRLFERAVPIIHRHGGRVDKFIGDGLMAVFGAPRRQADHADRALAAALEIEREVRGAGELEVGIGLNSGTVVAGNIGAAGRHEFGVIGDPVNIAARVESATRQTGDAILLTERTRELLREPTSEFVERTGIALKGKREPVRLFAPCPELDSNQRPTA